MILAEADPLRSEGEALADAMRRAGVWVDDTVYDGVTHGFFGLYRVVNKALFAQGRGVATGRRIPVGVAIELIALAVLVPLYGVMGAAFAFCAGSWGAALLLVRTYRRHHTLPLVPPSSEWRHAAALTAMVPVLLVARMVPDVLGFLLLGVAIVVHLTAARLLGVVTDTDLRRVTSVLARLRDGLRRGRRRQGAA